MKVKTSITISKELIRSIDELLGGENNRSKFIEKAVWDFIEKQAQKKRDLKDMDILNKKVIKLNNEAKDVLTYQADV